MKIHLDRTFLSHVGEGWAPGHKWGLCREEARGMAAGQAFTAVTWGNWFQLAKPELPYL